MDGTKKGAGGLRALLANKMMCITPASLDGLTKTLRVGVPDHGK